MSTAVHVEERSIQEGYLDCVHCGLCLSSCPTYLVLGNEMDSPRGRVYLMRAYDEGRAQITDTFSEHMFRCLDCRACETACPSGVQFGSMMEEMRSHIIKEQPTNHLTSFFMNHIFMHPWRFHFVARLLQFYRQTGIQGLVRSTRILEKLAPSFAAAEEMIPEVDLQSGIQIGHTYRAEGQPTGSVAFLAGCAMNSLLGDVNRATVDLLNAARFDVVVPDGQICCGALANHAGMRETACNMARTNLSKFPVDDVDAIIVNASGCGAMLAEYPLLIDGAEEFSSKVQDVSSFIALSSIKERLVHRMDMRVGYDDPCHLLHAQGIKKLPRDLLKAIPGVELIEVFGAAECCGSAGIYNLTQRKLSMAILDRKMEFVKAANLDVLVTGNPGCLFQLQYGVRRHGLQLEVTHIAEFVRRAI